SFETADLLALVNLNRAAAPSLVEPHFVIAAGLSCAEGIARRFGVVQQVGVRAVLAPLTGTGGNPALVTWCFTALHPSAVAAGVADRRLPISPFKAVHLQRCAPGRLHRRHSDSYLWASPWPRSASLSRFSCAVRMAFAGKS